MSDATVLTHDVPYRMLDGNQHGWLTVTVSVGLAGAAMLAKETGVTVLGVCAMYDLYCHKDELLRYRIFPTTTH